MLSDAQLGEEDVFECLLHIANTPTLVEDGTQRLVNQLHIAHKKNGENFKVKVYVFGGTS